MGRIVVYKIRDVKTKDSEDSNVRNIIERAWIALQAYIYGKVNTDIQVCQ
jgi:hypothetical protein